MLQTILLVAQVVISLALIGLVLLQKGKGAEAGAGFGAGASGTVFGAKGSSSFLSRSTAVLATIFFLNSMALANLAGKRPPPESILTPGISAPADALTDDVPTLDLAPVDGAEDDLPAALDDVPADEPEESDLTVAEDPPEK